MLCDLKQIRSSFMCPLNVLEIVAVVVHYGCRKRKRERAVHFKVVNLLCHCPFMQIKFHLKIHQVPEKRKPDLKVSNHM